MKRIFYTTILAAAAALAGCDQSDHTLTSEGPYDPNAANPTNAATVTLPPPIVSSKIYRCTDSSLVYVDWYADGSARLKSARTDAGTAIAAADVADTLKGDANSTAITANGQSCRT